MKRSIITVFLVLMLSFSLALSLASCGGSDNSGDVGSSGNGNGGSDNEGTNSGKEKTITVTVASSAEAGIPVLLEKQASFSPFYQKNIKYEFVSNNCEAEFSHELKNNYYYTYITAKTVGEVSVKLSYVDNGNVIAESNVVTVSFHANEISTVEELKAIAGSEKIHILANDIDLSGEDDWTPIENFKGTLLGGEYKIKNLNIASVNGESIGLFGTLLGTVKDLTVENALVSSRGDIGKAGILAGTNSGRIENVTVEGTVNPKYYNNVGGIAGYNNAGTIVGCTNKATVIGSDNVGGIVGFSEINDSDQITDCKNLGTVEGKECVGGIAGYVTTKQKEGTYSLRLFENGNTVIGKDNVGGIFGKISGISFSNKYTYLEISVSDNKASVLADGDRAGGIIGYGIRVKTLSTCTNSANITGGNYVGGLVGHSSATNIKANASENASTITVTGKGYVGGFAGYAGIIEYAVNNANVISTASILEDGNIRAYVGGIAGYCEGLLNCENNSDITVTTGGAYTGGLAGYICFNSDDAVKGNLNNGRVSGADCVGGIAGYLTIPSVRSEVTRKTSVNDNKNTVTGNSNVGGVFGEVFGMLYDMEGWGANSYGYIELSILTNTASVTGSLDGSCVGGLVGKGTRLKVLSACENTADITGGDYVGGFVGCAPGVNIKAVGAENDNTVTGKSYVGGFAGECGLIEDAVNNGSVISGSPNSNGESYVGGIAGHCKGALRCINNVNIEISNAGKYIGGIAGYLTVSASDMVNDNVNNGVVCGGDNVGGISGYLYMTSVQANVTYTLSNNKNTGSVNGTRNVGGIFGEVFGMVYDKGGFGANYYGYWEIGNCANEAEIIGTEKVGGIVGAYTRLKTDSSIMDTNTTLYGEKLGQ